MSDFDNPYHKKIVTLNIGGSDLRFNVSQTLFSSHAIDVGTKFLLRTLRSESGQFRKVLDLGCGYGPIGIALKALNPGIVLHMVDRDALAVKYASRNALLNGVGDAITYGSIGFDDVADRGFDLIAANIPGKASEPVIGSWLRGAPSLLSCKGQVGVVVVSSLEPLVDQAIEEIPMAGIVLRKRRASHTVILYEVDQPGALISAGIRSFDRAEYDRAHIGFAHGPVEYRMKTVFGLPQFDSLSYQTRLLFGVLENINLHPKGVRVLVQNPGQGHAAVYLSMLLDPRAIDMIDRDLLALRCSTRNLVLNGYDASRISTNHTVDVRRDGCPYDLIVSEMRDDEGFQVNAMQFRRIVGRLASGGLLIVVANSTTVTRLVKFCRAERLGKVVDRKRRRGGGQPCNHKQGSVKPTKLDKIENFCPEVRSGSVVEQCRHFLLAAQPHQNQISVKSRRSLRSNGTGA